MLGILTLDETDDLQHTLIIKLIKIKLIIAVIIRVYIYTYSCLISII